MIRPEYDVHSRQRPCPIKEESQYVCDLGESTPYTFRKESTEEQWWTGVKVAI